MVTRRMSRTSAVTKASWVAVSALLTGCPYDVVVGGNAPKGLAFDDGDAGDAATSPTIHCARENLPSPEGDIVEEIGVSLGGASCARTRRGEVLCWGLSPSWGAAPAARVAGLSCVRALASGRASAAVLEDGTVRTFRPADALLPPLPGPDGGLPDAPMFSRGTVVERPPGLGAVAGVDVGRARFCAWGEDGAVRCWGAPFFGQPGEPSTPPSDGRRPIEAPTLVPSLTDVAQMSTSVDVTSGHGCALHRDGTVSCLGQNGSQQLGDGTFTPRATPRRVAELGDVVQVSVAQGTSCAVRRDGRVMCWGGVVGDLPTGVPGPVNFVEMRGIVDATQVSVGGPHACARTARGSVFCWGDNDYGALGDGTLDAHNYPVEVPGLTEVIQVAVSALHSCALRADHTVWCWGTGAGASTDPAATGPTLRPQQIVL